MTRRFVVAVAGTSAQITDTRKTTPLWRELERAATRAGGAVNHRRGLDAMVLIKENHLACAGGIARATERVRGSNRQGLKVEVETTSLDEVRAALAAGVDRIMLDNMPAEQVRGAVRLIAGAPTRDRGVRRCHAGQRTGAGGGGGRLHLGRCADALGAGARPLAPSPAIVTMTRKASSWEGQKLAALRERWDRPHVHIYSRLDSTNTMCLQLAEEGAPAGTIVLADEQTAGRGAGTRRWHSPKGAGLYLSLILRPKELPNPVLVPLLAGLGAARAIEAQVGGARVGVKWPNDLIVGDRKAGGVLSEASWSGTRPKHVVLGIGVNVHQKATDFPPALRDVAISLDMAAGRRVSRLELADRIIAEVEGRCLVPPEMLERDFLRQFDQYDWLRDRRCSVDCGRPAPLQGTAVGIAPDGALLFRPDRGALERVTSGHVLADGLPLPEL